MLPRFERTHPCPHRSEGQGCCVSFLSICRCFPEIRPGRNGTDFSRLALGVCRKRAQEIQSIAAGFRVNAIISHPDEDRISAPFSRLALGVCLKRTQEIQSIAAGLDFGGRWIYRKKRNIKLPALEPVGQGVDCLNAVASGCRPCLLSHSCRDRFSFNQTRQYVAAAPRRYLAFWLPV